ncbi:monooxygenase [Aspergillus flavus]|nr:monooxygenase [Aspergillus flavus]
MTSTTSNVVDGVVRQPPTGIKVIIVGAGLAGLCMGIESWRKGHDVEIIERSTSIAQTGDIIGLGPHAWCTLREYPKMFEEWTRIDYDTEVHVCQQDGSLAIPKREFEWNLEGTAQHAAWPLKVSGCFFRRDVALMFFAQAQRLGIPITFGVGVTKYLEDPARGLAIIHTDVGQEMSADIVVAADGLGTKSHSVVLGYPTRAVSTGYCVDRAAYPVSVLKDSPVLLKAISELGRPQWRMYNGDRCHIVVCITKDRVAINSTHEDDGTATESWSTGVTPEQMAAALPNLERWDPLLVEAIKNTPPDSIVRWKLCLRNPQPKWTSATGRIVQVGDAAHSLLPTSANGAAMALEDSISLAECLRLGGKEGAAVATRVHQILRYQRTALIQHCGFVNRRELHNTSMKEVTDGGNAFLFYGKWLWQHNAENYAAANFEAARQSIELGSVFKNTNLPRGHVFEDWTMESELEKEKAGIFVQDLKTNGEWTLL